MAMALAATVVNRKEIPATRLRWCEVDCPALHQSRKTDTSIIVMIEPIAIIFIERSFCVRTTLASAFLPPISLAARLTALLMMLHERTIR